MEELLKEILKELQFHGKLLSSMVEMMDAGKHEHREKGLEIGQKIEELAAMMPGSPFTLILKEVGKKIGGNHHGQ